MPPHACGAAPECGQSRGPSRALARRPRRGTAPPPACSCRCPPRPPPPPAGRHRRQAAARAARGARAPPRSAGPRPRRAASAAPLPARPPLPPGAAARAGRRPAQQETGPAGGRCPPRPAGGARHAMLSEKKQAGWCARRLGLAHSGARAAGLPSAHCPASHARFRLTLPASPVHTGTRPRPPPAASLAGLPACWGGDGEEWGRSSQALGLPKPPAKSAALRHPSPPLATAASRGAGRHCCRSPAAGSGRE